MKRFSLSVLGVSIFAMMPVIAGAAGTYYNGNTYQNPQRYGSNAGGYYNTYGAGRGYGQNQSVYMRNTKTTITKKAAAKQGATNTATKQGFQLDAYLSHEFANWDFEMKNAGSKLRYDGVAWNVIGAEGTYYFGSSTPMQIKVGASYGKQFGETTMSDDDITNGAYASVDVGGGQISGYAMSLGTSKDGTQYGFNAAFGLTDFLTWGRVKVTPSIGYRYFKHELLTKDNSGLTMDVFAGNSGFPYVNCIEIGGETQCDPYVAFVGSDGKDYVAGRGIYDGTDDLTEYILPPDGVAIKGVKVGDTYYYTQAGTSHKYETLWQGPYVALDMEYAINNNNTVTAGIEFGLPMYESKGDQPYRVDWAHPTSVKDEGGLGDAYHLGLSALWSTAITDSTMLSLGMTYDYYRVNGADATTYLNPNWYQNLRSEYQTALESATDADEIKAFKAAIAEIDGYAADGWQLKSSGEVESIYSSMGIRLGINVKF